MNKTKIDKITRERIKKIFDEIDNDPKVKEEAEEYQRKYGTLTEEDLRIRITI